MTQFQSFTEDSLFVHLLTELDRPDCKTARQIVAKERTIYALRHDTTYNPLRVRMAQKDRSWLGTVLTIATAGLLVAAFVSFSSDVYRTSAERAREAVPHQTTTAPSPPNSQGTDFYPPEAP